MKNISGLIAGLFVLLAPVAHADWHDGRLMAVKIGYDGRTITFNIEGYARTNCTCYAAWNTDLCLNRNRDSFKEEVAMLYSARARGTNVYVNIDETTCFVNAIYEAD